LSAGPGIGYATLGVVLGFGLSMIQVLPFIHYIPFSPRAGIQGYEWSTTYATPWIHVPEFFISGFTGQNPIGTYWGPNHIKLHSEYLGLPVIALAVLGVGGPRKRLVRWILGIALLFFLIALGDGTPFYRVWWVSCPTSTRRAPQGSRSISWVSPHRCSRRLARSDSSAVKEPVGRA
jgi:hypothetical protein